MLYDIIHAITFHFIILVMLYGCFICKYSLRGRMTILIWPTYNLNQFVIYLNKLFQQKEKPQTRRAHLISYIPLYYHHWVDTSAGVLLVSGGIMHPVFSTGMVIVSIPLSRIPIVHQQGYRHNNHASTEY
jgi:uncharacterized membrane protein